MALILGAVGHSRGRPQGCLLRLWWAWSMDAPNSNYIVGQFVYMTSRTEHLLRVLDKFPILKSGFNVICIYCTTFSGRDLVPYALSSYPAIPIYNAQCCTLHGTSMCQFCPFSIACRKESPITVHPCISG